MINFLMLVVTLTETKMMMKKYELLIMKYLVYLFC